MSTKPFNVFFIAISVCSSLLFAYSSVEAATLTAQASRDSVGVGDTIVLRVLVSSTDKAINSAEGKITFPHTLFNLVSIDKSASLFTMWIQAPVYDGAHTISFNGGVPSPGYRGAGGTLFTVVLKAKNAGAGSIAFENSAVRANDGNGTDVLTGTNIIDLTVRAPATNAFPTQTAPVANATPLLSIASETNPSQDVWYNNQTAHFLWHLAPGMDSIQTLFSATKDAVPTVLHKPAVVEKVIPDIGEGIWYFALRGHSIGGWGPVSSYRIMIDRTPPLFAPIILSYDNTRNALTVEPYKETIATTTYAGIVSDTHAGIRKVEVVFNGAVIGTLQSHMTSRGEMYPLPKGSVSGTYHAYVRATDFAGNIAQTEPISFTVSVESFWKHYGDSVMFWLIIALFIFSFLVNVWLWNRIIKKRNGIFTNQFVVRIRHTSKQKLTALKTELHEEDKELAIASDKKSINANESKEIKRTRALLLEIQSYLQRKIDGLK